MNIPIKEIRLEGQLGVICGEVHRVAVSTVGEAISAIQFNTKKIYRALSDMDKQEIKFIVTVGGRIYEESEILMNAPIGRGDVVTIRPIPTGHSGKFFGAIIGAVLIVASVVFTAGSTTPAAFSALLAGNMGFASVMFYAGVSLLLGSLVQLLNTPNAFGAINVQGDDSQSYFFSGPVNIARQGTPVPLGYGELIVGSVVASQYLRNVPQFDFAVKDGAGTNSVGYLNDPNNSDENNFNIASTGWGEFPDDILAADYGGYETWHSRQILDARKINETVNYPVPLF